MWKKKNNSENSDEILQQIDSLNKTVQELKSQVEDLQIARLYNQHLDRDPTQQEIENWKKELNSNISILEIRDKIANSLEANSKQKLNKTITQKISKTILDEHEFFLNPDDWVCVDTYANAVLYEQEETTLLKKLLKKDMNVINIGANIGYFTLLAARQVGPQGKVFAFEPFPKTVELLQKNIDANGYSNVEVIPMAVSSKSGIAKLSTGGSSLHNIISSREIKEMTVIEIPQTSIDDFVSKKQIKIDFMIIDAEGSEPFILDGMKNTLENNPNLAIMIEFNPYTLDLAGSSAVEFLKIISNNEYLIYLIDETTQKVTPITVQQLEQDIEPPQVANLLLSKTQLMDI